jgi:hypothetical protein
MLALPWHLAPAAQTGAPTSDPPAAPAAPPPAVAPAAEPAKPQERTRYNPVVHRGEPWAMHGFIFRVPAFGVFASDEYSADHTGLMGIVEEKGRSQRRLIWMATTWREAGGEVDEPAVRSHVDNALRLRSFPEELSAPWITRSEARTDGATCFDVRARFGARAAAEAAVAPERVNILAQVCRHPSQPSRAVSLTAMEITSAEPSATWEQAALTSMRSVRFFPPDAPGLGRARQAFEDGNGAAGRAALEQASRDGLVVADYLLARRLALGAGLPSDPAAALPLAQRAAEAGLRDAKFLLAALYSKGPAALCNPLASVLWFEKAADMRHGGAQLEIARMYRDGDSVARSDERACRFLDLARGNGTTRAATLYDEWGCARRLGR